MKTAMDSGRNAGILNDIVKAALYCSSSLAAHDNRIQLYNLVLYECHRREVKMAGRTRDLVKKRIRQGERGGRGDERRVKKQRANDGQGTAGGRWQRSLFSGEIKMLI